MQIKLLKPTICKRSSRMITDVDDKQSGEASDHFADGSGIIRFAKNRSPSVTCTPDLVPFLSRVRFLKRLTNEAQQLSHEVGTHLQPSRRACNSRFASKASPSLIPSMIPRSFGLPSPAMRYSPLSATDAARVAVMRQRSPAWQAMPS